MEMGKFAEYRIPRLALATVVLTPAAAFPLYSLRK
ncbi:hypothetical protein Pla100_41800 [Neorhodopirellula pilleata]|uniref:Uncharacterized protein n=1 Tax=Neorhodopirellula pilleata TaxID=2714738 RepID=A0A5C6A1F3_9BACT|nr:hypothetical protein Pla100_41800 [Neorhodopirellula pilleata]